MTNFQKALATVGVHEGGYSNDPNDAGGPTNFGVTQEELSRWRGHPVTAEDVKNMPRSEAEGIFKAWYWDTLSLDQVICPTLATAMFDQGILSGVGYVSMVIQKLVNVTADGVIGPKTLAAISATNEVALTFSFLFEMQLHYVRIVTHDPSQREFLEGWISRTQDLIRSALSPLQAGQSPSS